GPREPWLATRASDGTRAQASSQQARDRRRLNPLQHDDRDRPRGLRHVFAKPGHVGGVLLVEAVTLRSARDGGRTDMELLGADLDVGLAGLLEVVVPSGVCGRAAL